MADLLGPFQTPFMQRALIEVLLLALPAGLLGSYIVLRRLAFFTHATGTAAFPGLVVAAAWGISPPLAALAAALGFAGAFERLSRGRRVAYDAATGLLLAAALAFGVILASDVFHSGAEVDTLLFGTLLGLSDSDLWVSGAAAAATLGGVVLLGRTWVAVGFDPDSARALGIRTGAVDAALLALVAGAVVASLAAVGALLVTALFVVPAATVRLFAPSVRALLVGSVLLAALEGAGGLLLAYHADIPPGPAIAVLGGAVFCLAAALRWALVERRRGHLAVALAGTALLGLTAAGCGGGNNSSDKLQVVATTTQVGDLVRHVGGENVDLTTLLKPNSDPHQYEPRPSDAVAVSKAKLVFESGDGLDAWMGKVIEDGGGSARVVDLSRGLPDRLPGDSEGPEASRYDPHWWQDPDNAKAAVREIRAALVRADPDHRALYDRNALRYSAQLSGVDEDITACFDRIPRSQRKLVTNHDAFDYFAQRYGVTVVGAVIPSLSSQAQPSAADTAKLVEQIRAQNVKVIFAEAALNPKLEQAVARESGAKVNATLYADTLGLRGSPGDTYVHALASDARQMARGWSGGRVRCRIVG